MHTLPSEAGAVLHLQGVVLHGVALGSLIVASLLNLLVVSLVVVGSKASVVGPEAALFTKMYVIVDGEETVEFDKNSIDLSDFSGVLEVKAVIEDANGNVTKSIAFKFKR